jgi:hypothetical protein
MQDNGMTVLSYVRESVSKSVYFPEDELMVYAGALVVSHATGCFPYLPRIVLRSGRGGFGKSQALRLAAKLAPNPWFIAGKSASGPSIRSHLMRPERPTLFLDEASKVFGRSGRQGEGSPLCTVLTDGYDAQSTVTVQASGTDAEESAYCLAFMATLGSLPEDIETRVITLRMVGRPKHVTLAPVSSRNLDHQRDYVKSWAAEHEEYMRDAYDRIGDVHEDLVDRPGQIWGPLIAVSMAAGTDETERMVRAFTRLGLDKPADIRPLEARVLECALTVADAKAVFSSRLREAVSTWPEFAGLTSRQVNIRLAELMADASGDDGPPGQVYGESGERARGWRAEDVTAALERYAEAPPRPVVPDGYDEM